jgi:hypothetical protein
MHPMHPTRELNEIDAGIFSGDVIEDNESRNEIKEYAERWLRAIAEHESHICLVGSQVRTVKLVWRSSHDSIQAGTVGRVEQSEGGPSPRSRLVKFDTGPLWVSVSDLEETDARE